MIDDDKKIDKKKGINPMTAGVIGAAVTVVAGTAAAVLSQKENRKKAGKILNTLKKKGQEFSEKFEDLRAQAPRKGREAKRMTRRLVAA